MHPKLYCSSHKLCPTRLRSGCSIIDALHLPLMPDGKIIGATWSLRPKISLLDLLQRDIVIMYCDSAIIQIGVGRNCCRHWDAWIALSGFACCHYSEGPNCFQSRYWRWWTSRWGWGVSEARLGHLRQERWEGWDADAGDGEGDFQGLIEHGEPDGDGEVHRVAAIQADDALHAKNRTDTCASNLSALQARVTLTLR